jgi:hypothetical protein
MHARVCAAFVLGDDASNNCPVNYAKIFTEAACKAGQVSLGLNWGNFNTSLTTNPDGCFVATSQSSVRMNIGVVGAGRSGAKLLCAGALNPTQTLTPRP